MEAALSSVLAMNIGGGRGSTKFWRNNARAIDLGPPPGTKSLTNYISGGTVLKTALAGVGVIDDIENAEALQLKLLIGQALVTRKGDLWRWDGFVRKATKSDKVADRIRQRRRIAALELELKSATEKQSLIASESAETESKLNTCREKFQMLMLAIKSRNLVS